MQAAASLAAGCVKSKVTLYRQNGRMKMGYGVFVKDDPDSPEYKKKIALWMYPDTLEQVVELYRTDNCQSRSEFIAKAVEVASSGYCLSRQSFLSGQGLPALLIIVSFGKYLIGLLVFL